MQSPLLRFAFALLVAAALLTTTGLATTGCTGTVAEPGAGMRTPDGLPPRTVDPVVAGQEFECEPDRTAAMPLIRRLTRDEYLASVFRLTGVDVRSSAEGTLPVDPDSALGFSNYATALNVQYEHGLAYTNLANEAASGIADATAFIDGYVDCRDASCFGDFVDALLLDAFGSPATEDEQTAFGQLYDRATERGDGFEEAAMDALEVALQSPRFLYHFEADLGDGSVRDLEPLELARRISFLLTGEVADETLRDAAQSGALSSDEGIIEQIDRLLSSPKAQTAARTFVTDWLDLGALGDLERDSREFPTWEPSLGPAMQEETLGTFDELVWQQDESLMRLFDTDFTVASPELAEFYGLPAPGERNVIDVSAVPERGGLLTHGGLLAISGGREASTVARGLFFLGQVTCGAAIPEPPDTVDTNQPPTVEGQSKRDISEDRVENPDCAFCHSTFEPPVWGLVRYDAVGLYEEEDEAGNFIPEDGYVRFVDGTEANYATPAELGSALGESNRVRECVVLNMSTYAVGRALERADGCSLSAIRDGFFDSDQTYRDLVIQIALSPMFRSLSTESGVRP